MKIITDLHSHILPDVDDGSPDFQTTITMLKEASKQGTSHLFATSHHFAFIDKSSSEKALELFQEVKMAIKKEEIPINLYLGCELLCTESWMDRLINGLAMGQYPSLNGTHYVLTEYPYIHIDLEGVLQCTERFLKEGWTPVFAHIERYYDTFASLPFIKHMKEKGCLFQVNFFSLVDEPNENIRNFAREVIAQELADFMGSDMHNMRHRPPQIEHGLSYLKENCSADYLSKLLEENMKKYFI
ncbi:MAG: hypothetical protein Q4E53_06545 [Eubacteriales bacterium]|nr:hypothetical protein [Eubacteriales bacterium]